MHVVSLDKELYSTFSLFTQVHVLNGHRRHTAGGNPVIDWHPVQGGVAVLLGMLHAMKETGISLAVWAFGSCIPLPYLSYLC